MNKQIKVTFMFFVFLLLVYKSRIRDSISFNILNPYSISIYNDIKSYFALAKFSITTTNLW